MDKTIPLRSSRFQADKAKKRNIVGRKINAARKRLGITQTDFAKSLSQYGVRIKTPGVNKWENGEPVPNAYQLLAICHALQIEGGLDYFTGPLMPRKEILNTYDERQPDEHQLETYLDSNGVLHPQIVLISQNEKYEPRIIKPGTNFRIVGRILN